VNSVNRVEDAEDEITWRWTANGHYTTQSAYRIQFMGRRKKPTLTPIWKAQAEPKCRIFAWILLQHKILTADNLAKRRWPHDPMCQLCNAAPETPAHLCLHCPFTQNVWMLLISHIGRSDLQLSSSHAIRSWWRRMRRSFDKKQKAKFDGLLLYFWWNIWKERNRRIFQRTSLGVDAVALLIINDTKLYQDARTIERSRTPPTPTAPGDMISGLP
jgi:hypothetical protein